MKKRPLGDYTEKKNLEWATNGLHKTVLKNIPISNAKKSAIDLGCGTGVFAHNLSLKGYEVTGVDFQDFLINRAIPFLHSNLDNEWPIKNASVDLVTALEVIEHLENPRHFLRELTRVLKNGGLAIISTPNILNWKARLYYVLKGIIWGFREKDYLRSGHITPVPLYDILRISKEVGLSVEKVVYHDSNFSFFGANLVVLLRKSSSRDSES